MSTPIKFIARNASAARVLQRVAGNPASARLESGVGNCFPGLECDLRNLERRFFPFLEVDYESDSSVIRVVGVDVEGVRGAGLSKRKTGVYERIASDLDSNRAAWVVEAILGDFGPLGKQVVTISELEGASPGPDPGRRPADGWAAVRLLRENTRVELTLARTPKGGRDGRVKLVGVRVPYLGDDGALAAIFEPGELTQSLCSPWTHDFRDCGCYYWASNHPDIALPALPDGVEANDADGRWGDAVPWERSDRGLPERPSSAATPGDDSGRYMDYFEINQRWPELDIVIERREWRRSYEGELRSARPLSTRAVLLTHLRYAAAIELAAIQEYLAAAYSLDTRSSRAAADTRAAFSEIMRVVLSEMRHLRIVNDVLRELASETGTAFDPALRVASRIPSGLAGAMRPVQARRLDPSVLDEILNLERPSMSADGIYARIVVTLEQESFPLWIAQAVRSIMSDGLDHYETFTHIKEWLGHYPSPELYLLPLRAPADDERHAALQHCYRKMLDALDTGYRSGLPRGGPEIAHARALMTATDGLQEICEMLARARILVTFDPILDSHRYAPIDPPSED